jgi:hypothetical protein
LQKIKKETTYLVPAPGLREAIEDTRLRRNLIGPFKTAEEAVASMLGENDDTALATVAEN